MGLVYLILEMDVGGKVTESPLEMDAKRSLYLGRDSLDMQLNYERISKIHCYFEYANNTLYICDNHSTNGTFLNDNMIGRSEVVPGDIIKVGPVKITLKDYKYFGANPGQDVLDQMFYKTSDFSWMHTTRKIDYKDFFKSFLNLLGGPRKYFNGLKSNLSYPMGITLFLLVSLALGGIKESSLNTQEEFYSLAFGIRFFIELILLLLTFLITKKKLGINGEFRHYISYVALTSLHFLPFFAIASGISFLEDMSMMLYYGWAILGLWYVFKLTKEACLKFAVVCLVLSFLIADPLIELERKLPDLMALQEKLQTKAKAKGAGKKSKKNNVDEIIKSDEILNNYRKEIIRRKVNN